MNKIFSVLLLVVLLIGVNSCQDNARTKLAREIEVVGKACPVNMGLIGELRSISYDKNENKIIFDYLINEDIISINGLAAVENEMKQSVKTFITGSDNGKTYDLLVESGAAIKLEFEGKTSKERTTIMVSSDELSQFDGQQTAPADKLETIVSAANKQCPQSFGDGLVMTKVYLEDGYVIYGYEYDSNVLDVSAIDADALKEQLASAVKLMFNDFSGKQFFNVLKEKNAGLKYTYTPAGSEDAVYTVVFEPEEIAAL